MDTVLTSDLCLMLGKVYFLFKKNISFSSLIEYLIFFFFSGSKLVGFFFLFVLEISDVLVTKPNQGGHFKPGFRLLDVPSSFLWCHLIQIWKDENNSSRRRLLKFHNDNRDDERRNPPASHFHLRRHSRDYYHFHFPPRTLRSRKTGETSAGADSRNNKSFHGAVAPDGLRRRGCKGS